jgi:hypothetical protein
MDLYSRCITGLRLSPVSTKSVDAALVLFEALRPGSRQHTSGGLLPYAGLPDLVVAGDGTAGLAGVAAETIVVDHGKVYLSDHLLSVCQRLGISVQPARPLTPTDKAAVERFFRTPSEGLLAALAGYKGPDVYSRGADPEGCAYFFTNELEQVVREWIDRIYHQRPHAGLAEPQVPGLELSPAEMLAHGTARAGRLKIPVHAGMIFDFLPVAWRTIQHYGVEVGGRPRSGSPPRTPRSSSASASSPPKTAPWRNGCKPHAPTAGSPTGASPSSKPSYWKIRPDTALREEASLIRTERPCTESATRRQHRPSQQGTVSRNAQALPLSIARGADQRQEDLVHDLNESAVRYRRQRHDQVVADNVDGQGSNPGAEAAGIDLAAGGGAVQDDPHRAGLAGDRSFAQPCRGQPHLLEGGGDQEAEGAGDLADPR